MEEVGDLRYAVLIRVEAIGDHLSLTVVGEHITAKKREGKKLRGAPTGDDGVDPSS